MRYIKIFFLFLTISIIGICVEINGNICKCYNQYDCENAPISCKVLILENNIDSLKLEGMNNFVLDCNNKKINHIDLINSKNITIKNCIFKDCFFGISSVGSTGIIKNNTFSYCITGLVIGKEKGFQNISLENDIFYSNSVGISLGEPIYKIENCVFKNKNKNFLIEYNCSNSSKIILSNNYFSLKIENTSCFEIKSLLKEDPTKTNPKIKQKIKIAEQNDNKNNKDISNNNFMLILISGIFLMTLVIVIIYLLKNKGKKSSFQDAIEFGE